MIIYNINVKSPLKTMFPSPMSLFFYLESGRICLIVMEFPSSRSSRCWLGGEVQQLFASFLILFTLLQLKEIVLEVLRLAGFLREPLYASLA